MTTLSIIIPTYNRAHFLPECIARLKDSGVADQEVIIVDDGSTDNTAEVMERHRNDVTYIQQANTGPAGARNTGFAQSSGRYIAFLDSDDEWLPGRPGQAIEFMEKYPEIDLLFADALVGDRTMEWVSFLNWAGGPEFDAIPYIELEPRLRLLKREPFFHRMIQKNQVFFGAAILRRETFTKAGMFDAGMFGAEDWNLALRIARTMNFAFWDEPFTYYIKHVGGLTQNQDRMTHDFCKALQLLPHQVALNPLDRTLIHQRLRENMFGFGYLAYDRGEYAEAKRRFAEMRRVTGPTLKGMAYEALCTLPSFMVRNFRKLKQGRLGGPLQSSVVNHALPQGAKV